MKYVAHRREDGAEQSVYEHLRGTAELAGQFAAAFDAAEQGAFAGWAHDIGKYSDAFQRRILQDGPRVDHASAGAYECAKRGQDVAAFCVAGHHGGLPDLGGLDDDSEGTLRAKLNRVRAGRLPNYAAWQTEITLPKAGRPPYVGKDSATDMFFTRMLYSCLVDADFLDTEHFMGGVDADRGSTETMAELEQRLEHYIADWYPPKGELNAKRCQILDGCRAAGSEPQGFFTLTVPTGGGKTVASLAFALKHAKAHGLRRVIYVVPYTSIIEQTADAFRQILGDDCVLEHHSGMEYDPEDRDSPQNLRMSLATENWDMPVIVTTAVQFFESLFANRSSRCRKNHNIAGSVLVFDEAQMLPVPYLRPCVYAIAQLVQHYHVSAVLCTATQPALDQVFSDFVSTYQPKELCPPGLMEDPVFKRTTFVRAGKLSWHDVAQRMNQEEQILCIVNSRKHAQEVFRELAGEGCYHLSTLMFPADRRQKLAEIRERLNRGEPCRVVSTSLIEAGVDVDFPIVLREEAGLDSVVQAAGRCNREGKRDPKTSIVTVFEPETAPPKLFAINIAAARAALLQGGDMGDRAVMTCYFQQLLHLKGDDALDLHRIIHQTEHRTFPFARIAEQFHLIEENTATVYIPIGEGESLLQQRQNGAVSRKLLRRLGQYAVGLYPEQIRALSEAGDILPLGEREWYLANLSLYDENTGLSLAAEYGKAEFI